MHEHRASAPAPGRIKGSGFAASGPQFAPCSQRPLDCRPERLVRQIYADATRADGAPGAATGDFGRSRAAQSTRTKPVRDRLPCGGCGCIGRLSLADPAPDDQRPCCASPGAQAAGAGCSATCASAASPSGALCGWWPCSPLYGSVSTARSSPRTLIRPSIPIVPHSIGMREQGRGRAVTRRPIVDPSPAGSTLLVPDLGQGFPWNSSPAPAGPLSCLRGADGLLCSLASRGCHADVTWHRPIRPLPFASSVSDRGFYSWPIGSGARRAGACCLAGGQILH